MTPEQRLKASIDLSLTYLKSYYPSWRLSKVLSIQKMLADRYEFYKEISLEVKQGDDETGEATIAQEIKNGLYMDAIAQCVQYAEDLFSLIKASKNKEFFIRNVITYDAGKVTNFLKSFIPKPKSIGKAFHFPHDLEFTEVEHIEKYEEGVNKLTTLVQDIIKFYIDYEFFYNQYKHGLAVPMRTFGNMFNDEQINKDKSGESEPYIAVYDNLNLHAASKKGTFSNNLGVMMPGFTDNVRPFISKLQKENNFLRIVHTPDLQNFNMELLVDNARKIRTCINIFITNYYTSINPYDKENKFQLPSNYLQNEVLKWTYKSDELKE